MEILMPTENDGASNAPAEPKYVTAEEIGNIVNSAVTSHLKRSLGPAIEAAVKPIAEKLAAAVPTPPPPGDEEGGKGKSKSTPEMLAMAKQLDEMKTLLQSERDARANAEKAARDDRAYASLRQQLEGKVAPGLVDIVAKNLFYVEKKVTVDETGKVTFKTSKAPYPGADPEEQDLPLESGVADFLKSDSAKVFLPAPSAGASSQPLPKRGPSSSPTGFDFSKPAKSDEERVARAAEMEARLKAQGFS